MLLSLLSLIHDIADECYLDLPTTIVSNSLKRH